MFGLQIKRKKKEKLKAAKIEVPLEKVPSRIRYQIIQQRDVIGGTTRTVILKQGRHSKKKPFLSWRGRLFFPNHIIKEVVGRKVRYIARWDVNYSEAMDAQGNIAYSPELNNLLMNDMTAQLRRAVGSIGGLVFDRTTVLILMMAMVFGLPIGMSYNDIFHWVPPTVIHWVPRV